MKERLWFLLKDSVIKRHCGAQETMDVAINTAIDLLCGTANLDKKNLKYCIHKAQRFAYDKYDYSIEAQELVIKQIEANLDDVKELLDKGYLDSGFDLWGQLEKEAAENE